MAIKTLTCKTCGTDWLFNHLRGRLPSQCEACKANPVKVREKKLIDTAETKEAAKRRIDALEGRLKANGSHLSQTRPRRSYSIAELEERIHQLERWKAEVDGETAPILSRELQRPSDPVDRGPEEVRRKPRRRAKASAS